MTALAANVVVRAHLLEAPNVDVARCRDDLIRALSLVYECYLSDGLILANRAQLRILPQHALSSTEVLIAKGAREIVSTVSIIQDNALGLPLESIYASEVALRRTQKLRLAEVSCLAERPCASSRSVLMKLMACVAQVSRDRGVDQLLIAVHPRHAGFYERVLGFEIFGEVRDYWSVLGNPAVGLFLNFSDLQTRSPRAYERLFGTPYLGEQLAFRPMSRETRECLRFLVASARCEYALGVHEETIVA